MMRRTAILLFAGLMLWGTAPATPAPAQDDDSPASANASSLSGKQLVQRAYEKTKAAQSERDYAEIIYLTDRAIKSGELTPTFSDYARQLKGWAHNRLGESLLEKNRESAALSQFKAAVELNPQHWKARHNRGVSYAIEGRLEDALADFTETLRLKPKFANAWFNRGEVHLDLGNLDGAIRDYGKAIEINPNDAEFFAARGDALQQQGAFEAALGDLNRAVALAPQGADYLVRRGDVYAAENAFDRAAQDYRQAVKLDDQSGSAYRSIAWLMATCPDQRFRDAKRAVAFAGRAIELDGKGDYRYLATLAAAQASAEQFSQAIASQQKAIALASHSAPKTVLKDLQSRLEQYRQRRPFRQERLVREPTASGARN